MIKLLRIKFPKETEKQMNQLRYFLDNNRNATSVLNTNESNTITTQNNYKVSPILNRNKFRRSNTMSGFNNNNEY